MAPAWPLAFLREAFYEQTVMNLRCGLNVSTSDPFVLEALDVFSSRLVRVAAGAEGILSAADSRPHEPSLQLATALLWLFGQTEEAQRLAGEALAAIPEGSLNRRERRWQTALTLWHEKRFESAAVAFESLTEEWPEDLCAAKAAEFLYYVLGQQFNGPRFRSHMLRLRPVHEQNADFLAMEAFAHELCGDMQLARDRAEASLATVPTQAWAQHALEHVLLWEGNSEAALKLISGWVGDWKNSARPIHSHNAWHLALAHLDRLESAEGFRIFDQHVWLQTPEMVVEQLDSIAFLWRAEIADVEVPQSRWQQLLPHIRETARSLFMPFATAQYAYALARAGANDEVAELLSLTEARASQSDAEAIRVWAPTGLSVVRAAAALARDQPALAADELTPTMPRITQIGGSDAQDDLFRFAHIDSLRRAGRNADACRAVEHRLASKKASPYEETLRATLAVTSL